MWKIVLLIAFGLAILAPKKSSEMPTALPNCTHDPANCLVG